MEYILYAVSIAFGVWVAWNARKRGSKWIPWGIAALLLWPIVVPLYLAKRPLMVGDRREGGTVWNVLKYFVLTWTLFIAIWIIGALGSAADSMAEPMSDAEVVGATIGTGIGVALIGGLWFVVVLGAVLLGFFLKNSTVEEGVALRSDQPAATAVPEGNG